MIFGLLCAIVCFGLVAIAQSWQAEQTQVELQAIPVRVNESARARPRR